MGAKLVDLSRTLDDAVVGERLPLLIRYVDHRAGARQMAEVFSVPCESLPDQLGWAGEEVTLSTHTGTHMDSPWHYGPSSEGKCARQISEVPLEWCYAPGVVLDFRRKTYGEDVGVSDLEAALQAISHVLGAGEIVLLMTGADAHWGSEDYAEHGTGLNRDAILWLVARGVRVIGTDAWSLDRPFSCMRQTYQRTGNVASIWPAHFAGREREYCQLEKLTNLDRLPAVGFTVLCFPIKVARASAGWSRVIAVLP